MKTLKILEIMWFTITIISAAVGFFKLISESLSESTGFFIIALLAFAFGFARRNMRIKSMKQNEHMADFAK